MSSIKRTIVGSPRTDLDSVITGLQWSKGYDFGKGVNAITGGLASQALQPFVPKLRKEMSAEEHYRFIQSESDLDREIEASASGKYNIAGVDVTASTEYLSTIKFSELSVTLVAEFKSLYAGYDESESRPQLTAEAKQLMKDKPAEFRQVYGDYFIAGGQRGSHFLATYVCQATSVESMDKFLSTFKGDAPELFSAEASASFMQAASENKIDLSFDLTLVGYEGEEPSGPWNPQKILEALAWFKKHQKGVYLEALLQHYNTIEQNYPRTIDIEPAIFIDLHQLYTRYWDAIALYGSCPKFYQKQYAQDYQELISSVKANESVLATNADLRIKLQQKADLLLTALDAVSARQDFYFKVKKAIGNEPAEGAGTFENEGVSSWLYGYKAYSQSSKVVISCSDMHYAEQWGAGYRRHTFQFGPDDNALIVGWEVIAYWTDGTDGEWWKAIPQILLTNRAAVTVKSLLSRGFDWGLRVYYVDAKNYQFEPSASDETPPMVTVRVPITAIQVHDLAGNLCATAANGVYDSTPPISNQVEMYPPYTSGPPLPPLVWGVRYMVTAVGMPGQPLYFNGEGQHGGLWFVSR